MRKNIKTNVLLPLTSHHISGEGSASRTRIPDHHVLHAANHSKRSQNCLEIYHSNISRPLLPNKLLEICFLQYFYPTKVTIIKKLVIRSHGPFAWQKHACLGPLLIYLFQRTIKNPKAFQPEALTNREMSIACQIMMGESSTTWIRTLI